MYHDHDDAPRRIQTGVRVERRMLKVLKALAEYRDMSLSALLEEIVHASFDGREPFAPATLERIEQLKRVYGLDAPAGRSGPEDEPAGAPARRRRAKRRVRRSSEAV